MKAPETDNKWKIIKHLKNLGWKWTPEYPAKANFENKGDRKFWLKILEQYLQNEHITNNTIYDQIAKDPIYNPNTNVVLNQEYTDIIDPSLHHVIFQKGVGDYNLDTASLPKILENMKY
jgi:hypothetical protein